MTGRFGFAAVALLVTLVFAGCASGSTATSEAPSASVVAGGELFADAGTVYGTVIDESVNPIAGAMVSVLELNATATTDAGGAYTISNVLPGRYRLAAAALGYESIVVSIEVAANERLQKTLSLVPIPIEEPYYRTFATFQGYFECRLARPTETASRTTGPCPVVPTTNDKTQFPFAMEKATKAIVGEMRWTQGSYATSQLLRMSFSYEGRPNTHWWCTETRASPIQWTYQFDEEGTGICDSAAYCGTASQGVSSGEFQVPEAGDKLIVYTNTPFGCHDAGNLRPIEFAYQQKFEFSVSIFQSMLPPEGFSGFPDM